MRATEQFSDVKFSTRITLFVAFSTIFCVLLVSTILLASYHFAIKQEMLNSNKNMLNQIVLYCDNHIAANPTAIISDHFSTLETPALSQFFEEKSSSTRTYLQTQQFLGDLVQNNQYIDSLLLYSAINDMTIDSKEGVTFGIQNNQSAMMIVAKQRSFSEKRKHFFVTPSENSNNIISYVQTLPTTDFTRDLGFISFQIDADKLVASAGEISQNTGSFAILTSDYKLLAHSNKELQKTGNIGFDFHSEAPYGNMTVKIGQETNQVSWIRSPESGLIYVSTMPQTLFISRLYQTQLISILLVGLLVLSIALSSRKIATIIHRPFKNYMTVGNILLEDKFVQDLLTGRLSAAEELRTRLGYLQTKFVYNHFYFIGADMEEGQDAALSVGLQDDIQTLFGAGCAVMQARESECRILIIVNTNLTFQQVQQRVQTIQAPACNCYLCEAESLEKLAGFYPKLEYALSYRFLLGYGNLITPDMLAAYKTPAPLSDAALSPLEKLLEQNETTEAKTWIETFASQMTAEHWDVKSVQTALMKINSAIFRAARKKQINLTDQAHLATQPTDTLTGYLAWFEGLLSTYAEQSALRKESIHHAFIEKITAYIASHISENLTLHTVSEAFKISPNYLSKIFKDETGVTFQSYITEQKLEYAARLLLESTCSIEEVTHLAGYSNPSYFVKLFKAKYGLTPLQYRKQNI